MQSTNQKRICMRFKYLFYNYYVILNDSIFVNRNEFRVDMTIIYNVGGLPTFVGEPYSLLHYRRVPAL